MSKYFSNFKPVYYRFGDNEPYSIFQNLTQYVDLIDQLKANNNFYQDYTIIAGERPDVTSFKLYGSPEYYWTFFLLNDKLRESGWPILRDEVYAKARVLYPHRIVTTKDDIATEPYDFPVGKFVRGVDSNTFGEIIKRNLELGQLVIDTTNTVDSEVREIEFTINTNGFGSVSLTATGESFHSPSLWRVYKDNNLQADVGIVLSNLNKTATFSNVVWEEGSEYYVEAFVNFKNPGTGNNFNAGEYIYYVDQDTGVNISALIYSEAPQYLGVHHYEDADGNWINIDPFRQNVPEVGATAVTYVDRMERRNEDLKQIKVIKPSDIVSVASEFYKLLQQ